MFKVGDKVRIKDQDHDYCGFYGTVNETIDNNLWIADDQNSARVIIASQSQVEAA